MIIIIIIITITIILIIIIIIIIIIIVLLPLLITFIIVILITLITSPIYKPLVHGFIYRCQAITACLRLATVQTILQQVNQPLNTFLKILQGSLLHLHLVVHAVAG